MVFCCTPLLSPTHPGEDPAVRRRRQEPSDSSYGERRRLRGRYERGRRAKGNGASRPPSSRPLADWCTLQMLTPEQDHIQELTKTNPFGQKQGIISSNHSFSSERGRTSRVKTKRKKARTRFNYKTNMKQAQLMHKRIIHLCIQSTRRPHKKTTSDTSSSTFRLIRFHPS